MGKLNATTLRYLSKEDFRVLTAVEMGMRNHEVVPGSLVAAIANCGSAGVHKKLRELIRHRLLQHEKGKRYDGYRLTNSGYDYLALKALCTRGAVVSIGNQIGVGKESDIYIGAAEDGSEVVLKFHRLGRTSFRRLREKRDYHGKRHKTNWLYMSRLSAVKEFAFMTALHSREFPTPKPLAVSRHCVVMSLVEGLPLCQVKEHPSPSTLYTQLFAILARLARHGLIHGDFNEFNVMLRTDTAEPVLIDFPQMVSTAHENGEWYFDRDVNCIREFFRRRFDFVSDEFPSFDDIVVEEFVDREVSASGYMRELEEDYSGEEEGSSGEEEGSSGEESGEATEEGEAGEGEATAEGTDEVVEQKKINHLDAWLEHSAKHQAKAVENLSLEDNNNSIEQQTDVLLTSSNDQRSSRRQQKAGGGQFSDDDSSIRRDDDDASVRRSIITVTSTIAPEDVRRRVQQQRRRTNKAEAQRKARRKAEAKLVKSGRREQGSVVKEYDGWDL